LGKIGAARGRDAREEIKTKGADGFCHFQTCPQPHIILFSSVDPGKKKK